MKTTRQQYKLAVMQSMIANPYYMQKLDELSNSLNTGMDILLADECGSIADRLVEEDKLHELAKQTKSQENMESEEIKAPTPCPFIPGMVFTQKGRPSERNRVCFKQPRKDFIAIDIKYSDGRPSRRVHYFKDAMHGYWERAMFEVVQYQTIENITG